VPQTENIFTQLTILENLQIAAQLLPRTRRQARIDAMLDMFPILADVRASWPALCRAANARCWPQRAPC
jgi:ABC-type branched-subunit amino acid transport system ATPase component